MLGSRFDVVINGEAALHGFAADSYEGVVDFFSELLQLQQDFVEVFRQLKVSLIFGQVKGRTDIPQVDRE